MSFPLEKLLKALREARGWPGVGGTGAGCFWSASFSTNRAYKTCNKLRSGSLEETSSGWTAPLTAPQTEETRFGRYKEQQRTVRNSQAERPQQQTWVKDNPLLPPRPAFPIHRLYGPKQQRKLPRHTYNPLFPKFIMNTSVITKDRTRQHAALGWGEPRQHVKGSVPRRTHHFIYWFSFQLTYSFAWAEAQEARSVVQEYLISSELLFYSQKYIEIWKVYEGMHREPMHRDTLFTHWAFIWLPSVSTKRCNPTATLTACVDTWMKPSKVIQVLFSSISTFWLWYLKLSQQRLSDVIPWAFLYIWNTLTAFHVRVHS